MTNSNRLIIKLFSIFLTLTIILLNFPIYANANQDDELSGKVQFYTIIEADLEGEEVDQEVINTMKDTGWSFSEGKFSIKVAGGIEEVQIDGESYTTDTFGSIEVPLSEYEEIITLEEMNSIPDRDVRLTSHQTSEVEIKVDLFDFLDEMDKGVELEELEINENTLEGEASHHAGGAWQQKDGVKPKLYHEVHCNRFNGPWGTGKYWAGKGARAIANFAGSDCNLYIGATFLSKKAINCMADYVSTNKFCSGEPKSKRGRCSAALGLTRTFHKQFNSRW